ncbi:hypothetical protein D9601_00755 [Sphingomonas sp. MA1305]|uniref:hypothetical protein n=1 Tax=Sphingomonas sp. MA1305 TaxID=2479204 RepID=UPI001E320559|nr:hypothetical protein [Sphingomonas sp. MA1305]MBI0473892.1 hypothetical protein [Sphingomonas sp. MA1305]
MATPPSLPNADSSDDIIVRALQIPREKLPVQVHWNQTTAFSSTIEQDGAAFFMRCAFKTTDTAWLRKAIDGAPNYASTRFAASMILMTHAGCYRPRAGTLQKVSINQVEVPVDLIDRGTMFEQTLSKYAPDATLTLAQTYDPAITQRLFDSEATHNRFRLPNDLGAFRIAMCLVQRQPKLATRFVHASTDRELQRGLTQTLLIEGRACLGNTQRVTIDPVYLRAYVAEAFYRWVVAARGVDSLIPAG